MEADLFTEVFMYPLHLGSSSPERYAGAHGTRSISLQQNPHFSGHDIVGPTPSHALAVTIMLFLWTIYGHRYTESVRVEIINQRWSE